MKFILFRAYGVKFAPERFAVEHGLDGCSFWSSDAPIRPGKPKQTTSGFRLPLPDANTNADVISLIQKFLVDGQQWILTLGQQGAECEFDIGMTVGTAESFASSISFIPSFLMDLARLRVGLSCSAYPVSS